MDAANDMLRNRIYPMFHEQARQFVHEGRACALRHLVDTHLASMENDPVGLKLLVAPKGMDRHDFETRINNRDFVHPQYFAVIACPVKKTIKLEFYKGDQNGETVIYYEKNPLDFDMSKVKTRHAEVFRIVAVSLAILSLAISSVAILRGCFTRTCNSTVDFCHFITREVAPLTRLQRTEMNIHDSCSFQLRHCITKMLAHTANLSV